MERELIREVRKMKKIEAIIRPEKLNVLKGALDAKGLSGMTITEVKGRGRQKGVTLQWRAGDYRVDFLPKIKLEMVADDRDLETIINLICETTYTGEAGDGKIFVYPVEDVVRMRTKERGGEAV